MNLGGRPRLYGRTRGLHPEPCPICNHEAWQHVVCNECNGPSHSLCTAVRVDPKIHTRYISCHCTWLPGQPKQETLIVEEEKKYIDLQKVNKDEAAAILSVFSTFVEFADLYESKSKEAIANANAPEGTGDGPVGPVEAR